VREHGQFVSTLFLPFEEAKYNKTLSNFIKYTGPKKVTGFGEFEPMSAATCGTTPLMITSPLIVQQLQCIVAFVRKKSRQANNPCIRGRPIGEVPGAPKSSRVCTCGRRIGLRPLTA
jgi:hypothetical protein